MTMQAGGMQQDPKAAFKAEWEALEIMDYNWALKHAEQEMVAIVGPTQENLYHQNAKPMFSKWRVSSIEDIEQS